MNNWAGSHWYLRTNSFHSLPPPQPRSTSGWGWEVGRSALGLQPQQGGEGPGGVSVPLGEEGQGARVGMRTSLELCNIAQKHAPIKP